MAESPIRRVQAFAEPIHREFATGIILVPMDLTQNRPHRTRVNNDYFDRSETYFPSTVREDAPNNGWKAPRRRNGVTTYIKDLVPA